MLLKSSLGDIWWLSEPFATQLVSVLNYVHFSILTLLKIYYTIPPQAFTVPLHFTVCAYFITTLHTFPCIYCRCKGITSLMYILSCIASPSSNQEYIIYWLQNDLMVFATWKHETLQTFCIPSNNFKMFMVGCLYDDKSVLYDYSRTSDS